MSKKLFVITNRKLITKGNIYDVVKSASAGGADAIILREKDLPEQELLAMAQGLKYLTDQMNTPLIVNHNLSVAMKIKAAGFHTGYENFINHPVSFKGIKGVSIHSLSEAIKAEKLGANYLLAGHVFATDSKKGLPGRGISFIREITANVSIPVIALGGINESNIDQVLNAGAAGAAVMSLIMTSEDPYIAIRNLKDHC